MNAFSICMFILVGIIALLGLFKFLAKKKIVEIISYRKYYPRCLAYVGFMTDGTPIIVVFDYALCTSGLEAEGKNKENSVFPATFECYADLSEGATDTLPYHIYTAVATA